MKKEHLIIGTFFATTALVQQACYRGNVPIMPATETPTITPTPFQPLAPTPTPPEGPTLSPTPTEIFPTATPTAAPEIFVKDGVEFDRPKQIFVVIKTPSGQVFSTSYVPLFYPFGLSPEEQDRLIHVDFMAGNHTGLTATDGKSIVLELHSGHSIAKKTKDEAEDLRLFLEGDSDKTILNPDYIAGQIQKLIGAEVTFTQNGKQARFTLSAIGLIPHDKMPEYEGNMTGALDLIIGQTGGPEASAFGIFKEKPGILLAFCGWGPQSSSNIYGDPNYRYTYTEYIIGLTPLN